MKATLLKLARIVAAAVLIAAALVGAALVVLVKVVDDETYRDGVVTAVEKSTGRQLTIAGEFRIERSLLPRFSASDVSLSNAPWGSVPEMLTAKRVAGRLELTSLLRGEIWFDIELVEPELLLEINASGEPNWALRARPARTPPASGASFSLPAYVHEARVSDGYLSYRDARSGFAFETMLDTLDLQLDRQGGGLELELDGAYNGIDVTVDGVVAAQREGALLVVDAHVAAGGVDARVAGAVEPSRGNAVDARFEVTMPSTEELSRLVQMPLPDLGRVVARGRLSGADGVYAVDELRGSADAESMRLTFEGSVPRIGARPELRIATQVEVAQLPALARFSNVLPALAELPPLGPATASGTVSGGADGYVVQDVVVRLDDARLGLDATGTVTGLPGRVDADLSVSVELGELSLLSDWLPLGETSLPAVGPVVARGRVTRSQGELDVTGLDVELDTPGLVVRAKGATTSLSERPEIDIALEVQTASLARLTALLGDSPFALPQLGSLQASARLTGRGRSLTLSGLDATLGSERLTLRAAGAVDDLLGERRLELDVDLAATSLADLRAFAEGAAALPDVGPFHIEGRLQSAGDRFDLRDAAAELAYQGLTLTVAGQLNDALGRRDVDLRLTADVARMDALRDLSEPLAALLPGAATLRGTASLRGGAGVYDASDVDLTLTVEGVQLGLQGTLADVTRQLRSDVTVTVEADRLDALTALGDWVPPTLPSLGPVSGRARVTGDGVAYTVSDLSAALAEQGWQLVVSGTVSGVPATPAAALSLELTADRTSRLAAVLPFALPAAGPLRARTELGVRDSVYALENLDLHIGDSDVGGALTIDLSGPRPAFTATLSSESLALGDLAPTPAADAPSAAPAESTRVFSAEALPLQGLRGFDVVVDYHAGTLRAGDHRLRNFGLVVKLREGALLAESLRVREGEGDIVAAVRLDTVRTPPHVSLVLEVVDVEAKTLLGLPDGVISGGRTRGWLYLNAEGGSSEQLMRTLSGKALFEVGEMRVSDSALGFVSSDILTGILHTLNPFSAKRGSKQTPGFTHYQCGVIGVDVENGVVVSDRGIAFQSDRFNVGGSGAVDLNTEKIDIDIRPRAREGLGLSISSMTGGFKVKGTLSNPQLGGSLAGLAQAGAIGAAGTTAASAAAASATAAAGTALAPATAGLSLAAPVLALGLHGRLTASQFACDKTRERIAERRRAATGQNKKPARGRDPNR